jgi:hypothetical protein
MCMRAAGVAPANGTNAQDTQDAAKPPGPVAEAVDAVSQAVGGGNRDGVGGVSEAGRP